MALNRQKVFDTAFIGAKEQGFGHSLGPANDGTCAYRGKNGRKCLIGHLIPDDRYTMNLESDGPIDLAVKGIFGTGYGEVSAEPKEKEEDAGFLRALQMVHDYSTFDMKKDLKEFAEKWNLTIPE